MGLKHTCLSQDVGKGLPTPGCDYLLTHSIYLSRGVYPFSVPQNEEQVCVCVCVHV